ncbi:MAG: transketolase [Epsilonproteobacteria bacterium]|nr:transketolase [Campylobacterota bacterium]
MPNTHAIDLARLEYHALQIRIDSIRATSQAGSGHPTSCLSAADIVSALFFHVLCYDLKNPEHPNNDRVILSKGHAIPVLYAAWKQLGVISDQELLSLRKFDSVLEGHPTSRFAYNEAATGSLGQGLSIGVGMALNARMRELDYTTYVILGDGEVAEGSVWEAAELAAHNNVDNLVAILDCNRLAQSGSSIHDHDVKKYARQFEAFGWNTCIIDGHNITDIVAALEHSKEQSGKPSMIIAKTFKGHGIAASENKDGFHGKPFELDDIQSLIDQLNTTFSSASNYAPSSLYAPSEPTPADAHETKTPHIPDIDLAHDDNSAEFTADKKLATRKAFGYALSALGHTSNSIIALDADVQNSTFTEMFAQAFPDRFIQCFIAEQNMVGIATGLQARGLIPFAATFGAFFTRCYDQIRMAGIGRNALRLCGSHSGVSIGEDGPSQMALEDIAMLSTIPDSIILYPSDAVATYKLTNLMAQYHDGISYLRTTRAATPVLYKKDEEFKLGGCKVLRQSDNDQVCIIAAGITLHEALKAHEQLKTEGIMAAVIDLYSVKPLDNQTIKKVAQKAGNRVITVEDHYLQGGIGSLVAHALSTTNIAVQSLAVKQLSRSGKPEELLAYAKIDAAAIVEKVKEK